MLKTAALYLLPIKSYSIYRKVSFILKRIVVSIENSVMKNKRERMTEELCWQRSNEREKRMTTHFVVLLIFSTFSFFRRRNYCCVNAWVTLCRRKSSEKKYRLNF
jgi:hypothetical protein